MLRNTGKQSGESVESVLKKKWKATVGRIKPQRQGVSERFFGIGLCGSSWIKGY